MRRTDDTDQYTSELFRIGIDDSVESVLSSNDTIDVDPIGGKEGSIYRYSSVDRSGIKYFDMVKKKETIVAEVLFLNKAFDGTRWVAYTKDDSGIETLYKYDVTHPENGSQLLDSTKMSFMAMSMDKDSHELVGGVAMSGTDGFDIVIWNMETNERTVFIDEPWDQGLPDSSGHVISYLDTQAAKKYWFGTYLSEVKIIDRETKVKRTVLPLETWYGPGIWGHYLAANNVGKWGDSIILCDLEAEGLMDTDGHVIPEGGWPDAGVDAGMDAGMDAGLDGGK
jgi:hypothetical protein